MSAGPRSHPRNREWSDPKSRLEKPESRNRWPQWLGLGVWFDELQRLPTQLRLPQKVITFQRIFLPLVGQATKSRPSPARGPSIDQLSTAPLPLLFHLLPALGLAEQYKYVNQPRITLVLLLIMTSSLS